MLSNWQKSILEYIPPHMEGYEFVERIPVFIPVKEFALDILERRIQRLSFVQECVLSMVESGIHTLNELTECFGIAESIMIQIVSQLDTDRLISISASNIKLTKNGSTALIQLRKEQVVQKQLNRLYLNPILGDILESIPSKHYDEPYPGAVYLDEIHELNLQFLREKLPDIERIYKDEQVDKLVFKRQNLLSSELYRIIGIPYQKLKYIKEYCFVYVNKEDRSINVQFKSGNIKYTDALLKQIHERKNGASRLFQRPPRTTLSPNIKENLNDFIVALRQTDLINNSINLVNEYYKDRMLLDGELLDFIQYHADFQPTKIWIETPYLSELFENNAINFQIGRSVKEIFICHSDRDYGAKRIIDNIKRSINNRNDIVIHVKHKPVVDSIIIRLDNKCIIHGYYEEINTSYKSRLFKTHARIVFDQELNAKEWNGILSS